MGIMDTDNQDVLPLVVPPGARVEHYGDGVIVRSANGKFEKGSKPPNAITSANARDMQELRKQKTASLMRAELVKRGRDAGIVDNLAGPSTVIAVAAGQIFDDVVLKRDANPRYRLESWQAIGRHAGLLGDARQVADNSGVTVSIGADLARDLVAAVLAARKAGVE